MAELEPLKAFLTGHAVLVVTPPPPDWVDPEEILAIHEVITDTEK